MAEPMMDLILALKSKCELTDRNIRHEILLSPSEYRGLISIRSAEEWSAVDFSRMLGVSVSRGSRVIEKMIRHGYLARLHSGKDRRFLRIVLTPRGNKFKKRIAALIKGCERKIRVKLSAEEWVLAETALQKILNVL